MIGGNLVVVQFDHQIFLLQSQGGISRYFIELAKALRDNPCLEVSPDFNFRFTVSKPLVEAFPEKNFILVNNSFAKLLLKVKAFIPNRRKSSADIFHYTYYLPRFVKQDNIVTVSTLHDMVPEMTGDGKIFFNPHLMKKGYLESSDLVISVSEASSKAYYEISPTPRKEIGVVPLGVSSEFFRHHSPMGFVGDPFFLYVGGRKSYKSADTLLHALSQVKEVSYASLVFVGGGPLTKSELRTIESLGLEDRVRQVSVDDEGLVGLYTNTLGLVITSKLEGFGLPVLEAAALRCPIFLTDIPSSREVIGDYGHFFDVGDVQSLADLLRKVGEDPNFSRKHVGAAWKRASHYTWSRCAIDTVALYKRALSEKSKIGVDH
jgi:glycosyltransferase involved in cell wall biosynthesis